MISLKTLMASSAVMLVAGAAMAECARIPARMLTRVEVDRVCDNASKFAEANVDESVTFWDVTAGMIPTAEAELWWRIDGITRAAVLDPLGGHGPNTQVSVWRMVNGVLLFDAFLTSDSGDWAYFIEYCYRPDGKLARTSSTFNSFVVANVAGGISRERTTYFNPKGKVTGSRSTVRSLESGEKLKIQVTGSDEPAYMSVEAWPFHLLLSDALGTQP